jgi:hypothetical protein
MTSDPGPIRTEIEARVRNARIGFCTCLILAVVWAVLWATGGDWFYGVLALAWFGLAAHHLRNLRRLRRPGALQD